MKFKDMITEGVFGDLVDRFMQLSDEKQKNVINQLEKEHPRMARVLKSLDQAEKDERVAKALADKFRDQLG
jgi:hypothetical protein